MRWEIVVCNNSHEFQEKARFFSYWGKIRSHKRPFWEKDNLIGSRSHLYFWPLFLSQVKPYLPFEWTPKGMLERVNAFTEYLVSLL